MKTSNLMLAVLALALLCTALMASPVLQIDNYTTVPTVVYAGTSGYLEMTVRNTGDATASSAAAYYTLDGVQQTLTIGDMAAGGSSTIPIPFHIDPSAAGGIQVIGVEIDYQNQATSSSTGQVTSSATKKTSLLVPLPVAQNMPLVVSTLSAPPSFSPGERITLQLALRNNNGFINNLFITTPANSTFSMDGTTQETVGTVPPNDTQNVTVTLLSSSTTATGTYSIPLVFTYYDRLNNPTSDNLSVGPVSVQAASTQYRLTIDPTPVEVGSQAPVQLRLTNTGSQTISATVDVNSTADLTPIGTQRIYFDSVAPGQTQTQTLTLGVSAGATPGYYALPLTFTPSTGGSEQQSVGVAISATPAVTVSLDQAGTAQAALLIANTGNSGIRSVYATVSQAGSGHAAVQDFIGTLNVDDYGTVPLTGMTGTVSLNLTFKDSLNLPHEIDEQVNIGTGAASFISGTGGTGTRGGGAGNNFSGRGGGPLGFLTGGRGANGASTGPDWVAIGIGLVVLIVIAFFARRYWLSRQKKKAVPGATPPKGKEPAKK